MWSQSNSIYIYIDIFIEYMLLLLSFNQKKRKTHYPHNLLFINWLSVKSCCRPCVSPLPNHIVLGLCLLHTLTMSWYLTPGYMYKQSIHANPTIYVLTGYSAPKSTIAPNIHYTCHRLVWYTKKKTSNYSGHQDLDTFFSYPPLTHVRRSWQQSNTRNELPFYINHAGKKLNIYKLPNLCSWISP